MADARMYLQSVRVAAIVLAAGMQLASAQETVAPVSNTPVPGPVPELLQKYAPVTADRLKNPEDGNWLLFRRSYDGWGYSPLKEITPANANRLQLVWSSATGQIFRTAPFRTTLPRNVPPSPRCASRPTTWWS